MKNEAKFLCPKITNFSRVFSHLFKIYFSFGSPTHEDNNLFVSKLREVSSAFMSSKMSFRCKMNNLRLTPYRFFMASKLFANCEITP